MAQNKNVFQLTNNCLVWLKKARRELHRHMPWPCSGTITPLIIRRTKLVSNSYKHTRLVWKCAEQPKKGCSRCSELCTTSLFFSTLLLPASIYLISIRTWNDLFFLSFSVDIWDTAGQESFNELHPTYYFGAHVCILVFDVTRKVTYTNLRNWYAEMRNQCPHIPCICIANKVDL